MKKSNPLFVDSTRFQGDSITTRLEVEAAELADGVSVIARVRRESGQVQNVALVRDDDSIWRGQLLLEFQEACTVQLVTRHSDQLEILGDEISHRGTYMIRETWRPIQMSLCEGLDNQRPLQLRSGSHVSEALSDSHHGL